jgi:hypothetical protein
MRFALIGPVFLALSLASASATAATCKPGASRVSLTIEGATPKLAQSLRDELTSELERGKLCASDDGDEPLARIAIVFRSDTDATVRIVDAVTKKTVERDVSVTGLPPDGRALPIAIAADELLRASWAEITLSSSTGARTRDVPKVVRESVELRTPPPGSEPFAKHEEIGLRFQSALFGGGQSELGGVLFYRHDFLSWLSAEIFAYGREGLVAHATDGTIHAHAVGGGLALAAHVVRVGRFRLGPEIGTEAGYILFEGSPIPGATATKLKSVTSFGLLGLASAIDLAPVRFSLSAFALAPFRGAKALDGTRVVTGASGAGFEGNLGAGVTF